MQKIEIKNEELKKIVNLISSKNYLEAISKPEKLIEFMVLFSMNFNH